MEYFSTSWKSLRDLKQLYQVQVVDYYFTKGIVHDPEFNWWVENILKNSSCIIALVKRLNYCYIKWVHKFGIELSKSVGEALLINKNNGNTL